MEEEHGIPYDKDVDAFLRACAAEGKRSHPLTNFYMRILGLEVCNCVCVCVCVWGGGGGGRGANSALTCRSWRCARPGST